MLEKRKKAEYISEKLKGREMKRYITITDFAEKAGVSTATVSRAFTGNGRISETTRKRLLELAAETGYSPDHSRGPKPEGILPSIVFCYPEIYQEEPDYFIAEIALAAKRAVTGDHIFVVMPFDENDDHVIDSAKTEMLRGSAAGFLIVAGTPGAKKLAKTAESSGFPYVIIGSIPGFEYNSVHYDNECGGYLAGKYFRETGRRRPVYVTGHLDTAKQKGFRRGFGSDDIPLIPGGAGFRFGVNALNYILAHYPDADCVLCANDIQAMGLLREAANKQIPVPGRLAVIGFDNIAAGRFFIPAVSTVSLHLQQIGKTAMELLRRQIGGETHVQSELVQCDLILRQST